MKINEDDIVVRLLDMPTTVRGFVSPSPDGVYNIYLNARQTFEVQRETYRHEIRHIQRHDMDSRKKITELETK